MGGGIPFAIRHSANPEASFVLLVFFLALGVVCTYFRVRLRTMVAILFFLWSAIIAGAWLAGDVVFVPPQDLLVAHAGEWITRTEDNSRVCRLVHDIKHAIDFGPDDCDYWTEPVPVRGQWIKGSSAERWVWCQPGTCRLHFQEGWRP